MVGVLPFLPLCGKFLDKNLLTLQSQSHKLKVSHIIQGRMKIYSRLPSLLYTLVREGNRGGNLKVGEDVAGAEGIKECLILLLSNPPLPSPRLPFLSFSWTFLRERAKFAAWVRGGGGRRDGVQDSLEPTDRTSRAARLISSTFVPFLLTFDDAWHSEAHQLGFPPAFQHILFIFSFFFDSFLDFHFLPLSVLFRNLLPYRSVRQNSMRCTGVLYGTDS